MDRLRQNNVNIMSRKIRKWMSHHLLLFDVFILLIDLKISSPVDMIRSISTAHIIKSSKQIHDELIDDEKKISNLVRTWWFIR